MDAMITRSISLAIVVTGCTATRSFNGVTGSGPNDVWVVGASTPAESSSSTPIAYRWDGSAWSLQAVPGGGLNGAWTAAPNDVWFAGESMLRWNAGGWSTLGDDYMRAVWGDGAGTVFAVGLSGRTVQFDANGTPTDTPNSTTKPLFGVWGSSAADVWAVGLDGTVIRWQGTSWTPSTIPTTTSSLNAISGNASDDVWSVGDEGTIVHWDGAAWAKVASGTQAALGGVWADGSGDVWAVGGEDLHDHYGVVLHFDGSAWTQVYRGDSKLVSVWGTSANDVWAVGVDLTVAHWNGTAWSSTQLAPPE